MPPDIIPELCVCMYEICSVGCSLLLTAALRCGIAQEHELEAPPVDEVLDAEQEPNTTTWQIVTVIRKSGCQHISFIYQRRNHQSQRQDYHPVPTTR